MVGWGLSCVRHAGTLGWREGPGVFRVCILEAGVERDGEDESFFGKEIESKEGAASMLGQSEPCCESERLTWTLSSSLCVAGAAAAAAARLWIRRPSVKEVDHDVVSVLRSRGDAAGNSLVSHDD